MTNIELIRALRQGNASVINELRANNALSATTKRTFGVEIECIFPNREAVQQFVRLVNSSNSVVIREESYNHITRQDWKIVTDSSLRSRSGHPREIVSPILKGQEGKRQLKIICNALNQLEVKVNTSCGLHIHFGVNDFKLADFKRLVKLYTIQERHIDKLVSKSRRGEENNFCGTLQHVDFDAIDEATTLRMLSYEVGGRYHKLNLEAYFRHGTIEIRQHQGTTQFDKISEWIDLGQGLLRWAKYSKLDIHSELFTGCELSTKKCSYWNERIQQLA